MANKKQFTIISRTIKKPGDFFKSLMTDIVQQKGDEKMKKRLIKKHIKKMPKHVLDILIRSTEDKKIHYYGVQEWNKRVLK